MREWRKICCAVDFSETSLEALETAIDLALRFRADLTLFHAYQVPGYTLPEGIAFARPSIVQQHTDAVMQRMYELKTKVESEGLRDVEVVTELGEPSWEIVRYAEHSGADLIVLGTHGRTGISHALMGSTAEKVVRRAPCPVLTIHLPAARAARVEQAQPAP
jgi:nucleotide-binding universal stress UspA family protein